MKKTVCVLLFMGVVISLFAGCSFFSAKDGDAKEFSSDGLTLTLTDKFSKAEIEGYTVCYDSFDVAVFALKESFADYPQLEGLTLDEYKEYVLEANASKAPKEDTSIKDLTVLRFDYYIADKKANYTYFVTLYHILFLNFGHLKLRYNSLSGFRFVLACPVRLQIVGVR